MYRRHGGIPIGFVSDKIAPEVGCRESWRYDDRAS